jgi:hypothetical protein
MNEKIIYELLKAMIVQPMTLFGMPILENKTKEVESKTIVFGSFNPTYPVQIEKREDGLYYLQINKESNE